MIIRGVPSHLENYIIATSEQSEFLHANGFYPNYIDGNKIYYKKTEEIESVVRKLNEKS